MFRTAVLVLALTTVIAVSQEAFAEPTITTPVIPSGINTGSLLVCAALNTGKKAVDEVTVQIINSVTGVALVTDGPNPLGAGRHTASNAAYSGTAYCRVTGLASKKAAVSFMLFDATGNVRMSVTAP